jgi:uncharacterized protein YsxB (DUF464 family)
MTKATFDYQNPESIRFEILGHAHFARAGQDIVCSAISTAVFTTLNLLDCILEKDQYLLNSNEQKGIIQFETKSPTEIVIKIIDNLYQVLAMIAEDYPNNLKLSKK